MKRFALALIGLVAPGATIARNRNDKLAGTWRLLQGDKVIHHVEISSVENWVRTDLVRSITFEEERITLTTAPLSVGGRMQITELIFERVKS